MARLKLPDLWRAHPAAWFMKAEALFTAHRITADQTKFSHVVAALDAETFIQLQDAIQGAPSTGKYEHLKQTVISRFADSADRSLQKLLNEMSFGADRPSQLLAKMKNLSQSRISDDVLRVRWAALLPANVQPLLKILPSASLNELALLADRLLEGQGQVSTSLLQADKLVLQAANSSAIRTYGRRKLTLDLNLRRDFTWPFIVADVHHAIIGADFLEHFGLLVDVKHRRLVNLASRVEA